MDKKLRETTNLCVEIMNNKRQVMGKLAYMVQIRVCRQLDVNLSLVLLFDSILNLFHFIFATYLAGANAIADSGYRQP